MATSLKTKWRKCDHPRTPENTAKVSAKRPGGRCRICQHAAETRYRETEKGRATRARYRRTENGRAAQRTARARYSKTENGRAARARYRNSEKAK